MDTATADGVRLVPPEELPACIEAVCGSADDFVLTVGVPLQTMPDLFASLLRVARGGGLVRVVLTPAQLRSAVREVAALVAERAVVLVSERRLAALVATPDAAVEAPSAFDDVPHDGARGVLVMRSGAGPRWVRVVARAKLAQLGTRPAARMVAQWLPRPPEPWHAVLRALFRS